MKDAVFDPNKNDFTFPEGEVSRAQNLFDVQIGTLYFLPEWGIDLDYFLNPDFKVQSQSFEAYLLQRLGAWEFNVINMKKQTKEFTQNLEFTFGKTPEKTMMRG